MHNPPSDPRSLLGIEVVTHQGRGVFIVTAAGHELAWLLGKPGAPRRPRTLHCGRCDELLYLSDFDIRVKAEFERAVAELRIIIEQHGGAACP